MFYTKVRTHSTQSMKSLQEVKMMSYRQSHVNNLKVSNGMVGTVKIPMHLFTMLSRQNQCRLMEEGFVTKTFNETEVKTGENWSSVFKWTFLLEVRPLGECMILFFLHKVFWEKTTCPGELLPFSETFN